MGTCKMQVSAGSLMWHLFCLLAVCQPAVGDLPAPAARYPTGGALSIVPARGEALGTYLSRAGGTYGSQLGAARAVESQRVIVCGAPISLSRFAQAMVELLHAPPDGAVLWVRTAGEHAWRLEENLRRRRIRAALADEADQRFREGIARELGWLKDHASGTLAATTDARRRISILFRMLSAGLVSTLSESRLERFLIGDPIVWRIGALPEPVRSHAFEWLELSSGWGRAAGRDRLHQSSFVVVRERHPSSTSSGAVLSIVSPENSVRRRTTILRGIGRGSSPARAPSLGIERKVTVRLDGPGGKPGERMRLPFADLLEQVAQQGQLTVIADGYLRPPVRCDRGFTWKQQPLDQVLDAITRPWRCQWRFLDNKKDVVLIRADHWWLEDAADVPEATVQVVRERLGPGLMPTLDNLTLLARLRDAQVWKLIESGACPAASGLLYDGLYDGGGAISLLRLFAELPPLQRQQVQSAAGLPLQAINPRLLHTVLSPTLLSWAGAVDPNDQAQLRFRIGQPLGTEPQAYPAGALEFSLRHPDRFRTQYAVQVGDSPVVAERISIPLP